MSLSSKLRTVNGIHADIELLAATLPEGGSSRSVCPYCMGGRTAEKSFVITRLADGIAYVCHRASCPMRGVLSGNYSEIRREEQPKSPPKFELATLPLALEDDRYFMQRFMLTPRPRDMSRAQDQRLLWSYVMPIIGPDGKRRGVVQRKRCWSVPEGSGLPTCPRIMATSGLKARTWPASDKDILQSWYVGDDNGNTVVLVEDQISAMLVRELGLTGVALLGVHMDAEKAREIRNSRPGRVVIALDPDATDVAFEMARNWGLAWPHTRVALLPKDLKDIPFSDRRAALAV